MPERWTIARLDVARESSPVMGSATISRDSMIKLYRQIMAMPYRPNRIDMSPAEYERQYGPLRTIPAQRGAGDA